MTDENLSLAIIGMGPRGLSVLERIVSRLSAAPRSGSVQIYAVDPGEMGAGRIWRTDQPEWLLMNTAAGEVSIYSSGPDGGPWRAGVGPSLYEWLCSRSDPLVPSPSPNDYVPRCVYGRYLQDAYQSIISHLPSQVTVHEVHARARALGRAPDGRYVLVAGDQRISIDKAVLTTGHPRKVAGNTDRDLLDFASRHHRTRYLRGDSAADMEIDAVEPGEQLAILGLGLTFYDVVTGLTVGRGGRFLGGEDGHLRYIPSGNEPRIAGGSRSGLPLLARGRNQKEGLYRYTPRIFTPAALADARRQAMVETGSPQLLFREHVLPLILREVEHVYYTTHIRRRDGEQAARVFAERHQAVAHNPVEVKKLLADTGLLGIQPIDLEGMARPFAEEIFADPAAYHARLLQLLASDIAEAELGNIDGPLKAALDILRDIRGVVRKAVEFSSLHPDSQRDEFLGWFNPINTMLSAGPPAERIAQTIALIEAGVLTVVGPDLRLGTDEDTGEFVLTSPQVHGSTVRANVLIDARIPRPEVHMDASPLMRQLINEGLASAHVNINARDGSRFATGALAVDEKTFRLVDAAGRTSRDLYALGIPTEELRWFTQIGNGRPGPMVGFHSDADAIAADLLAGSTTPRRQPTAPWAADLSASRPRVSQQR